MSVFLIRHSREIAKSDYELRHVCLSVHPFTWTNSAPTGRIFRDFDIGVFLEDVSKIQVPLKCGKNDRYFT